MFPRISTNYLMHVRGTDPKTSGQSIAAELPIVRHVKPSRLSHNLICDFCISVLSARLPLLSAFRNAVVNIVGIRSQEKMIGIATWGIVTVMEHVHSFWYWSIFQFIGQAVRSGHFSSPMFFCPSTPIDSVSKGSGCSPFPWPAFIRTTFLNPSPKIMFPIPAFVSIVTQVEMIGIATQAIVAFLINTVFLRNRSEGEKPRNSIGSFFLSISNRNTKIGISGPQPAFGGISF